MFANIFLALEGSENILEYSPFSNSVAPAHANEKYITNKVVILFKSIFKITPPSFLNSDLLREATCKLKIPEYKLSRKTEELLGYCVQNLGA